MSVPLWAWLAVLGVIAVMLAVDPHALPPAGGADAARPGGWVALVDDGALGAHGGVALTRRS